MSSEMKAKSRFRKRYELLHRGQEESLSEQSHAASNFVKPTTILPARVLPGHRHKLHFRFGVAILITVVTLTTFSLIIRNISNWIPFSDGSDSYLEQISYEAYEGTRMSCDLSSGNGSRIEKAFTINLRSPMHLSFAAAKGIDVAWDLFVGQGGRLLLASISYIVFMDGLTRLLETSAVSYQLYATIVFDHSSLLSTWTSLKAVFTGHGWRGRAFLAWFFVASIYVLAFPALMSAATGYLTPSTFGVRMPDQSITSSPSTEIFNCLNITNRLNSIIKLNETLVSGPSLKDALENSLSSNYLLYNTLVDHLVWELPVYGGPLDGINMTNSFVEADPAYTINITLNGTFHKFNNYDISQDMTKGYCYNNQWLPPGWGQVPYCLPESYFVWGFSSLLLYVICSLQIAWTVGMFIVWLDANINSQLCRTGRKTRGFLRPALDITEAVRDVLGEDLCTYQSAEIFAHWTKWELGCNTMQLVPTAMGSRT